MGSETEKRQTRHCGGLTRSYLYNIYNHYNLISKQNEELELLVAWFIIMKF